MAVNYFFFIIIQLAGGILTDNYNFNTSAEQQRIGRFWGGGQSWEKM